MDKVFVEGLEVLTTIGVYDWEKDIKQKLRFDLEMGFNTAPAAKEDDINKALDYATLSQVVTEFVAAHQFELLETMAERVAELIFARFAVQFVKVRLTKPNAIVNAQGVGVEILRTRKV
ncbi:dihydroneopterin aldolase [Oceanisphaera avium]|uniref:7,8-dihydroneopterin aldolase n=1 Tax=Oceanisphaera avium TaxID=1903694 RepID=A0A1Y0CXX0_9GAMM|nr:dihydroneopterin aldolase [Oceanisphaera avium]ART80162.1 dihydroneopterin aldolase [Oceanisphaera avium]